MCKQHHYKEALDFYLKNPSIQLEPSTYTNLVLAWTNFRSLEYSRKIHDRILKSSYQPDIVLQNHILNMYGKCGSLRDARKVFDAMQLQNVISWTLVISGYSQNGQENDAIIMYIQMLRSGHFPDQITFGSIIKACSISGDINLGMQLHAHVMKTGFGHHIVAQNALISMYTKFGQISQASDVFTTIATKDLVSWGSIITRFTQLGYGIKDVYLFIDMLTQGVYQPNEFIFGSVFSACSSFVEPEFGRQIHGVSTKFGLGRNIFVGCSLCDMYAKFGLLPSAKVAFHQIENPDLVSWNAIIAAFADSGDANEAISFFRQMIHMRLIPDNITLLSLLCACGSPVALSITILSLLCACGSPVALNQGMQIHSYITKIGFDKDAAVSNSLLTMYTKCSNLPDAFNVFKDVSENANIVSWNAILSACLQHKQAEEAFRLFKLMLRSDYKPDSITITNLLGTGAELACLEVGNQVHCYCVKSGLVFDVSVRNGLIDMYAKCGSLKHAQDVFNSTQNPDIVSWSSLIVGYAQFGLGHEALNLFRMMRKLGVQPNEAFIKKTRFDPDITTWKTLLASCKIHGNVDIAKRAAENILKLDPSNSSVLVLLCNIHASAGNWEEVAKFRSLMKQMGLQKVPGQSWIEVKDKIHIFFSEDTSHPQRGTIYTMLEELWLLMLDDGYDPCHMLDINI
ncbi:hypothetical protein TanjilG_18723 [Lupinus angustifolius]|uniref:Pentacotripeptide-repeat region of PRORP domain-containing protein n=1 Tax=Lupinus angustifolius TaxID=3871 RepID=A0A1J7FW07_LUPAN|nr:hypothetical protein TanjilG_18723 [Lupinus angustifolius]